MHGGDSPQSEDVAMPCHLLRRAARSASVRALTAAIAASCAALAGTGSIARAAGYLDGDPVGQRGCFQLDRSRARTMSVVRDAKAADTVVRREEGGGSPYYVVELRYVMYVYLLGDQDGLMTLHVPAEYFTPEFLVGLRQSRMYRAADFSMEWLGQRTVTTLEGVVYRDCDDVVIRDVRSETPTPATDLEIHTCIAPGAPGLGAVQLDMTGRLHGFRLRGGLDLASDASYCPGAFFP
jgi:hypothetical protein